MWERVHPVLRRFGDLFGLEPGRAWDSRMEFALRVRHWSLDLESKIARRRGHDRHILIPDRPWYGHV